MRIPILLLALQMTVLALLPCRDLAAATACQSPCDKVEVVDEDGDHDAPGHDDDCSPLCSCSCCGILADTPSALAELPTAELIPPPGQTRPASSPEWKTIDPDTGHGPPPRA